MPQKIYKSPLPSEEKENFQKRWWRHPRAGIAGWMTFTASVLVFLCWLIFMAPYLYTDDARIAVTTVRIAPPGAGGLVIKLNVTEGARVSVGQVLVELDHRTSEAQLQRARARLVLAEKGLKRMEQMAAENGFAQAE